jgi:hypothetical protein
VPSGSVSVTISCNSEVVSASPILPRMCLRSEVVTKPLFFLRGKKSEGEKIPLGRAGKTHACSERR